MCPASAEDKYYAIRLIKCSFKKRKKIKNTRGVPSGPRTRGVPSGPRLVYYVTNAECCYSCYLQALNVVNVKNGPPTMLRR